MITNHEDVLARVPEMTRHTDPVLVQIDRLLDDDVLFARVRADLVRRYPQTGRRGRHSTPVGVLLRMLVIKRLYTWSYEETEERVADSLCCAGSAASTLSGRPTTRR